jgi:Holliday junction resolvase RusA-like endonuclease
VILVDGPVQLEVVVYGRPAAQGSKNCTCKGGKAIMFEQNSKYLRPFRKAVKEATAAAVAASGFTALPDMPLALTASFAIERPASTKYPLAPAGSPDLDKMLRAVMDGLSAGGAWADDARIVELHVAEGYAGDPGYMEASGVRLLVSYPAIAGVVGTDDEAAAEVTCGHLSHRSGDGG